MGLTFKKPPLLEIIAEVRWQPAHMLDPAAGVAMPIMPQLSAPYEATFLKFTAKMGAEGYESVERLVPYSTPMLPHAPAVRLRPKHGMSESTLYQIGPNMFSANATPPYISWDEFKPKVELGLVTLLACRAPQDANAPLFASLRYIDAFRGPLLRDASTMDFLSETLGVRIQLPTAITEHRKADKPILPRLQLTIPLEFGTMSMNFAEGQVEGERAVFMDTSVLLASAMPPDAVRVMEGFSMARKVIHSVFVKLTKSIADQMIPTGADE